MLPLLAQLLRLGNIVMKATPLLVGLLPLVSARDTNENNALQSPSTACAQAVSSLALPSECLWLT